MTPPMIGTTRRRPCAVSPTAIGAPTSTEKSATWVKTGVMGELQLEDKLSLAERLARAPRSFNARRRPRFTPLERNERVAQAFLPQPCFGGSKCPSEILALRLSP